MRRSSRRKLARRAAQQTHPQWAESTFKELCYDSSTLVGLFTTAGVPEPTLKAMREMLRRAIQDPAYQQAMQKANVDIDFRDTPEFTRFFNEDYKRLAPVVARIAAEEAKK